MWCSGLCKQLLEWARLSIPCSSSTSAVYISLFIWMKPRYTPEDALLDTAPRAWFLFPCSLSDSRAVTTDLYWKGFRLRLNKYSCLWKDWGPTNSWKEKNVWKWTYQPLAWEEQAFERSSFLILAWASRESDTASNKTPQSIRLINRFNIHHPKGYLGLIKLCWFLKKKELTVWCASLIHLFL